MDSLNKRVLHTHTQLCAYLVIGLCALAMASFFSSCGSSPPFSTYLSKNKVHPYITSLNFLPGTTLYSGKTIYWVINSDGLVKETYIKWGKDPGHLDHIGKHYFASLYLLKSPEFSCIISV
ncbi:MAG: hypothetical protein ACP5JP_01225 [bacterium]